MKTLLVGINSKYIHTCLAIWYLRASINGIDNITVREFTINDMQDNILSEIYREKPGIIAFSCYIWNIGIVLSISKEIKKLLPDCHIILGGPDVSYDSEQIMSENGDVDFVISGEGEDVFPVLVKDLYAGTKQYKTLQGIAYKSSCSVIFNKGFNLVKELDKVSSPYNNELMKTTLNRIVYYESSRGCPFSCSYCISSTFNGIRFFSMERVKSDIFRILEYKPRLIKFVDRTFNCHRERAKEIIRFLISLNCETVFHFEAAADLFDSEMLDILRKAPKGRIQLEIGIQTINTKTLKEIDRVTDIDVLTGNVKKILSIGNIHVHLDLIAGLPYENFECFKKSFNYVYNLKPQQLQLGFLKMLKGSRIREESEKHGFYFRDYAPYEVLKNKYISYDEILLLKDMEETFERYYNSGRFGNSLNFIEADCFTSDSFNMYEKLAHYCRKNGYLDRPVSYRENIKILYSFYKDICQDSTDFEKFRQYMVLDFLSTDSSGAIPDCIKREDDSLSPGDIHSMLRNEEFIDKYLPQYKGTQAKNILKRVFFVKLNLLYPSNEVLLFDYSSKDEVSGKYQNVSVKGIPL
ncbi:B12-binding domain-containing radical SAM protein [Ruminiclostridium papyrosolvens]|uniref:Radical SAM protein n=1 Tax=Ruminiclostridium papyrosolvens C7 TaxID=1330534 RepID=U4QYN8_9FIRM|nr:B12-binding domain-containing radical SAM protein [Ruminiclostridium papyrosolvens]EPR08263.1 radical SAM protein [Ruminiclostridium papyrosolvens C7]